MNLPLEVQRFIEGWEQGHTSGSIELHFNRGRLMAYTPKVRQDLAGPRRPLETKG